MLDRLPDGLRGDEDAPPLVVGSGKELYDAIEGSFPPMGDNEVDEE